MVASDGYWRFQVAALDEVVNGLTHFGTLAIPQPADTRRQSVKVNALARKTQPTVKGSVVREQFQSEIIGLAYIFLVTRERHPAKRSLAFAEKWPNVFRHKARNLEGIFATSVERLLANVVAIVKDHRSRTFQSQHRLDVTGHRGHRLLDI